MTTTRRAFLGALGAGACLAAQSVPAEVDVVIVGAGSAGLHAARRLQELGKRVVVIEARERIGGRAYTNASTFGFPFDYGCAWLHKADDNPYTPLARQWGYTLQEHDTALEGLYFRGREATADLRGRATRVEQELGDRLEKLGRRRDVAASTAVRRRSEVDDAVATFHGPMSSAVDLDELSARDYLNVGTDVPPNFLVKEGYGTLVAQYGKDVPVTLNTAARRIRYGGEGVQVDTDNGTLRAKACIVTSSTGVLAAEKIRFDPPLPAWKEDAIAGLPMGLLAKIPLQFSKPEFRYRAFEDVLQENPGKRDIYFLCWPFQLNLLVGFVGGDFAWELSAAGEAEAVDFARNALRRMWGSEADKYFVKGDFTKWASDPWALGAYAAATPGNAAAREGLRRPLADRVFFAGEACAPRWTQTCGGAALSGMETAEQLAKLLP
ncbi:MAG: FAD-dependent oxidoreductase [Bryobacterales bacterium]|nr:FAD-dependent oxidoreductase [Bryobacterales bacterium]